VQNGGEKVGVFLVTGTMKLFFFATGQIGIKFGKKRLSVSCILNLKRRFFSKISLKRMILPANRHLRFVLTGLRVTGLQFMGYVCLPSITRRASVGPPRIDFFVRLTVSAVEAPKVTQISKVSINDR